MLKCVKLNFKYIRNIKFFSEEMSDIENEDLENFKILRFNRKTEEFFKTYHDKKAIDRLNTYTEKSKFL
jgi:hypothetical protein